MLMSMLMLMRGLLLTAGQYVCGILLLLGWAAATWRPPVHGSQAHPSQQPMLLLQLVAIEGILGVVSCAALRGRGLLWWLAWVCWLGSSCWGALSNQQRVKVLQERCVRVATDGMVVRSRGKIEGWTEVVTHRELPPLLACADKGWFHLIVAYAPFLVGCVPWLG
jgi:hypothetical protein